MPTKRDLAKAYLRERIEVLRLREHVLQSRIRATEIPEVMEDRCRELERMAEELFDQAQRMRATLSTDIGDKVLLETDLKIVKVMLFANEYALRHKIYSQTDIEKIARNVLLREDRDLDSDCKGE